MTQTAEIDRHYNQTVQIVGDSNLAMLGGAAAFVLKVALDLRRTMFTSTLEEICKLNGEDPPRIDGGEDFDRRLADRTTALPDDGSDAGSAGRASSCSGS